MRYLFLILFLVASTANATIARVQSASGTTAATAAASFTITPGAAFTAGNVVIVTVGEKPGASVAALYINTSTVSAFSVAAIWDATGVISAHIFYCIVNSSTASLAITNTGGGNISMCGVAVEYSGWNIRPDTSLATSSGNSSSPVTGTITSNYANELLVGCLVGRGTYSSAQTAWITSPTNSFSSVLQTSTSINTSNADVAVAFLERIETTSASVTAGGTNAGGTLRYAANGASFREVLPTASGTFGN